MVIERLLHIEWPSRRCDTEQPGSAQDWAHYSPCCALCCLKPSARYVGIGVSPVKDGVGRVACGSTVSKTKASQFLF